MDTTRFARRARRVLPAFCLCAALSIPWAAPGRMTNGDQVAGTRLLAIQLPAGSTVRQANCEQLLRAVRLASLAHHQEAASILAAALSTPDRSPAAHRRSCECVVQIFRAAVNAAPDHASELLETAEALCPECADGLATMLGRMEDKNVVADPKDYAAPSSADPLTAGRDPRTPSPSDLSDRDYQGIGTAGHDPGTGTGTDSGVGTGTGTGGFGTGSGGGSDPGVGGFGTGTGGGIGGSDSSLGGFGSGIGPGFPGAPGFSGSSPGGGFALPRPVSPAVTSVVNG